MQEEILRVAQAVSGAVKMRLMDLDGVSLAETEADLRTKLIPADEDVEGEVLFEINAGVDPDLPIAPNVDYEYEEMTPEQREVFEAMQEEELEYEELEDDFVALASGGELLVKGAAAEPTAEDVKGVLDKDIKAVKGSLISDTDFRKILSEDRKALGLPDKQPEAPAKASKGVLRKKKEAELAEAEDELTEDKKRPKQVQFEDTEMPLDAAPMSGLELMGFGHKKPNKNETVKDEKMKVLPGGGKLILRTVQKQSEAAASRKDSDGKAPHPTQPPKEGELADYNSEDEGDVYEEEVFDDPNYSDDGQGEADLEDMPYRVDSDRSHITKSDDEQKDFSVSDDEAPMTTDQLKQLYKEYKEDKERMAKEKGGPVGRPAGKPEAEVVATPWDYTQDKLAQAQAYDDGSKAVINDAEFLKKTPKADKECADAPGGRKKPTNYFYMEVVDDNDQVKPMQPKPRREKTEQNAHRIPTQVPSRRKDETPEEKAERKKQAKEIKDSIRQRNREFKDEFKRMKKDYLRQQNRVKETDPLQGVSRHTLKADEA